MGPPDRRLAKGPPLQVLKSAAGEGGRGVGWAVAGPGPEGGMSPDGLPQGMAALAGPITPLCRRYHAQRAHPARESTPRKAMRLGAGLAIGAVLNQRCCRLQSSFFGARRPTEVVVDWNSTGCNCPRARLPGFWRAVPASHHPRTFCIPASADSALQGTTSVCGPATAAQQAHLGKG